MLRYVFSPHVSSRRNVYCLESKSLCVAHKRMDFVSRQWTLWIEFTAINEITSRIVFDNYFLRENVLFERFRLVDENNEFVQINFSSVKSDICRSELRTTEWALRVLVLRGSKRSFVVNIWTGGDQFINMNLCLCNWFQQIPMFFLVDRSASHRYRNIFFDSMNRSKANYVSNEIFDWELGNAHSTILLYT